MKNDTVAERTTTLRSMERLHVLGALFVDMHRNATSMQVIRRSLSEVHLLTVH